MASPFVIGLCGKMGSGKTVVAKYLAAKHGFIVEKIAADIKFSVARMTGTSMEDNMRKKNLVARGEYEDGEVRVMSLGEHQVLYGKKQRRLYGDDVFVKRLWKRIHHSCCGFIVDDVRLPCEADFLTSKGSMLIRIERSMDDRQPFMHGRNPKDITEVGLDNYPFEHVIRNVDTGLRELFDMVDGIVDGLICYQ